MSRTRSPRQQRTLRRKRRRDRIRARRPRPERHPTGLLVAALVLIPPLGIPATLNCDWPKARKRWAAGLSAVWMVSVTGYAALYL